MQIVKYIILSFVVFLTLQLSAQTQEDELASQQWVAEVEDRILNFMDELDQLSYASNLQIRISDVTVESGSYTRMLNQKIQMVSDRLMSVDYRWNIFKQSEQDVIASDENLMELMSQIEQLKQAIADTLESQKKKCEAVTDFVAAERLISSQDSVYEVLYKKAMNYSLVQKLTPQLEKLKAEEQVHFERIQSSYDKSKNAADLIPQLDKRAASLNEQYFKIKALSEKIQAMEYKPFVQRVKDYLLEIACVSVILMFFTMLTAKLKAAKNARAMLKKQKDLLNRANGSDYPTI